MIMHRSSIRSGRIALLVTLLAATFSTAGTARAEPAIDRIEPGGGHPGIGRGDCADRQGARRS